MNQPKPPTNNNQRAGRDANSGSPANTLGSGLSVPRSEAVRASKRSQMDAQKIANQYNRAESSARPRANVIKDDTGKLKISYLGGQEAIGEKNMQVVEWENDALILDCGNHLGIELPGINYTIADTTYLESIKHKLRGYVISHGHLDHL